jgi:metal-responsive CopG/Arc/MetJ family transcriptional regulator
MIIHMKAIQVTLDEELLRRLDALPEVTRGGRSAFFRRVARQHLEERRRLEIREAYARGYGNSPVVEGELDTEPERLAWPED